MDWPRVKTILLCVLAAVNAVLLAVYLTNEYAASTAGEKAAADLRSVLASQGMTLADEAIPSWREYALVIELRRDAAGERAAAEALLGEIRSGEQSGGTVAYHGSRGTVRFRSAGAFDAELHYPTGPVSDLVLWSKGLLEEIGLDGMYAPAGQSVDSTNIFFEQRLGGLPVYGYSAELVFEDGALAALSGSWATGERIKSAEPEEFVTGATALLRFADQVNKRDTPCREIYSLTLGYAPSTGAPDYIRLVPTWRIECDLGVYFVNGLTGEVSGDE